MKASKPSSLYVDEDEMDALAARLLRAGKRREATEVMKLRALEFPKSYEAFQKLGDAYNDAGDSAQFQANYKKSLELNRQSYPWERTAYSEGKLALTGVKLLSKRLARDIEEKGIEAALAAFERGKAGGPGTYNVNESEINSLGYQLLAGRKVLEAIEIFKLNTKEFPNSWNAYDSLGEAYSVAGEKALAIKNYRKSIELNPQNTNGIEVLKRLEGNK
jgi:tetratricopeptide (TPR) repeat protein